MLAPGCCVNVEVLYEEMVENSYGVFLADVAYLCGEYAKDHT